MKKMFATLVTLALALILAVPTLATAQGAQEGQAAPATQSKAPAKSSKKPAKKNAKKASGTNAAKPATATPAAAPQQ